MILSKRKIARKVFVSVYSCCGLVHCAYTIHIIIIVHWEYIFQNMELVLQENTRSSHRLPQIKVGEWAHIHV